MSDIDMAFRRIKIRVGAAVFDGDEVALIRRTGNTGTHLHSLPGGNVEPGEPLSDALRRELSEELGLDTGDARYAPTLTWLVDAMVSRPGRNPPRKIHLVYRVHIDPHVRRGLNKQEHDDTVGTGQIEWLDYRKTAGLNLFPRVPLAGLPSPDAAVGAGQVMLPAMDDTNYRWL